MVITGNGHARPAFADQARCAAEDPRFVALHDAGRLPVERLVTHRLGLDELNAGFDRLAAGEAVRQVVVI